MAADLWLSNPAPADLNLVRDHLTGADLFLTDRRPADLVLLRSPDRAISLHGGLPPVRSQITAQAEIRSSVADLAASLPGLTSLLDGVYDNAVFRGVESPACGTYQAAAPANPSWLSGFVQTVHGRRQNCHPWQMARRRPAPYCGQWQSMAARDRSRAASWQGAAARHAGRCSGFDNMRSVIQARRAWFQATQTVLSGACLDWFDLLRLIRPLLHGPHQRPRSIVLGWCGNYQDKLRTPVSLCGGWAAGLLRCGWGGPFVIVIPPIPPRCQILGRADLILKRGRGSVLVLRDCIPQTGRTIYIPIERAYIVSHDIHLIRVSDNYEYPVLSLSVSIDADSWGWQFSGELPADQLSAVQPDANGPIEVEAQINTYPFRFLIESIRRDRAFASQRIRVSGRSLAARLDDPYSLHIERKNTQAQNVTQILDDLLKENGVNIGWTTDFQLTDWLVPAGAWSHSGNYMEGIQKIAAAAGGIVQADRTSAVVHLLPYYPVAPWDWPAATPLYLVPEAVIVTESVEWLENPPYNAVFVSGETQGIVGHAVRSGTAGDVIAPLVTHPLITAQEAAYQRALAILGQSGKKRRLTLNLPLDPVRYNIGLMTPNDLIEYGPNGDRGLVRSTSVQVDRTRVRQSITLEVNDG